MKQALKEAGIGLALIVAGAALASLPIIPVRVLGIALVVAGAGYFAIKWWWF